MRFVNTASRASGAWRIALALPEERVGLCCSSGNQVVFVHYWWGHKNWGFRTCKVCDKRCRIGGLSDNPRRGVCRTALWRAGCTPLQGVCIKAGVAVQGRYACSPRRSWTIAACLAVKKRVRSAWETLWNWVRSCRRRRCIVGLFQGGVVSSHATYRRASAIPSSGVWSAP